MPLFPPFHKDLDGNIMSSAWKYAISCWYIDFHQTWCVVRMDDAIAVTASRDTAWVVLKVTPPIVWGSRETLGDILLVTNNVISHPGKDLVNFLKFIYPPLLNMETWEFAFSARRSSLLIRSTHVLQKASEGATCPLIYLLDFIFLLGSIY